MKTDARNCSCTNRVLREPRRLVPPAMEAGNQRLSLFTAKSTVQARKFYRLSTGRGASREVALRNDRKGNFAIDSREHQAVARRRQTHTRRSECRFESGPARFYWRSTRVESALDVHRVPPHHTRRPPDHRRRGHAPRQPVGGISLGRVWRVAGCADWKALSARHGRRPTRVSRKAES